jgi:hypothetical protein
MGLDFGGFGKEFAVDQVIQMEFGLIKKLPPFQQA